MKQNLTAERARELFHYDGETGIITQKLARRGVIVGREAGAKLSNGHIKLCADKKQFLAHRLVWLYVTGEWPKGQIDHINGVPDDNRFCNLRDVDQFTNMQNLRAAQFSKKSCSLLGAYLNKTDGHWYSQIKINGKNKHIGIFETAELAHQAYVLAKRLHHKGCTI